MEEIFGPEGLIAQHIPEYEYRPGQWNGAGGGAAFEIARPELSSWTSTGKRLPIWCCGGRVRLAARARHHLHWHEESSGTVNGEDIPFLQVCCRKARFLKGRNNYLCLHRLGARGDSPVLKTR